MRPPFVRSAVSADGLESASVGDHTPIRHRASESPAWNQWQGPNHPPFQMHQVPIAEMGFKESGPGSLAAADANYRKRNQPNGMVEYYQNLVADVAKNGIKQPLIGTIRADQPGKVDDGYHRTNAASQAGLTHVPVMMYNRDHPEGEAAYQKAVAASTTSKQDYFASMPPVKPFWEASRLAFVRRAAGLMTPEELAAKAHEFAKLNPQYGTQEGADGNCENASKDFLTHIGAPLNQYNMLHENTAEEFQNGLVPTSQGKASYVSHDNFVNGEWAGAHVYAKVPTTQGDMAVDHTMRQVDPNAPFPMIQPIADHVAMVNRNWEKENGPKLSAFVRRAVQWQDTPGQEMQYVYEPSKPGQDTSKMHAYDHQANWMGSLEWHPQAGVSEDGNPHQAGEIWDVNINGEHRGKGIGRALVQQGIGHSGSPIYHSDELTPDGNSFAKSTPEFNRPIAAFVRKT